MQPAGAYRVETEEERLEGVSFPAYRRVGTVIRLPLWPGAPASVQSVRIDPLELTTLRERDALAE